MKLILLGDGPYRTALAEAIQHYGLCDVVEIKGPVDEVGPYLEDSDAFVLPSFTEGLSNSALEAMAYGLPVILSRAGGNSDLVEGNGMIIDPADVGALKDVIQWFMDHSEDRKKMGDRSRQIVERRYGMEKVARQYEELYRSLKH